MGRSQETFNKKENEKKRVKKKQDKLLKKQERQSNSDKGKGIEEMFAYVDANGQLSDTPPDPKMMKKLIKIEDIQISISRQEDMEPEDVQRTGKVTYFNESKGYGFIKDSITGESVFVHINNLDAQVSENDKVSYETEMGKKGLNAIKVKIIA